MNLREMLANPGTAVSNAISPLYIVILYLGAIYLLLATLGVQQFQARDGDLTPQEKQREGDVRKLMTEFTQLEEEEKRLETALAQMRSLRDAAKKRQYAAYSEKYIAEEKLKREMAESAVSSEVRRELQSAFELKVAEHVRADQDFKLHEEAVNELQGKVKDIKAAIADKSSKKTQDYHSLSTKLGKADKQAAIVKTYAGLFDGMPKDWLTLILALSMGVFGSAIYVTRVFFGQTEERVTSSSWYFIRPLLGAVIALVIYLGLKAGVLVFSAKEGGGTADDLNPFAIAFLCVVAGIFSERAYQWIDSVSKRYLGGGAMPTQARRAKDLGAALTAQNKSPDALATFVSEPRATVDSWIAATTPVPPGAQAIIAGWLGKPPRELFSEKA